MPLPALVMRSILTTLVLFSWACYVDASSANLQVGFYSRTCPIVEDVVRSVVQEAVRSDGASAARLLRLQFHDCFIRGCDASILIDKPGQKTEKDAGANQGLGGFDIIQAAKDRLEEQCPSVVSCADILALAARDSIVLSGGLRYDVPLGRRDGLTSNIEDAERMPDVLDPVLELKAKFTEKGMTARDLVLLSAAHTIGTTACFFVTNRLYGEGQPDPTLDPQLLRRLMSRCPEGGDVGVRVSLDQGSEMAFDNQILSNIQSGFGVIKSDAVLYEDPTTRPMVDMYASRGQLFATDFADAMVRMGQLGVLTGNQGEIRRVCSTFN